MDVGILFGERFAGSQKSSDYGHIGVWKKLRLKRRSKCWLMVGDAWKSTARVSIVQRLTKNMQGVADGWGDVKETAPKAS